ncbi:MAG: sensor domain-containing diguanylate cyclase [Candidatus Omnitrophota bacterium]
MYPLKYRLIFRFLISILFFIFAYSIFLVFSKYQGDYLFVRQLMPFFIIVSAILIILSPITIGPSGHWVSFFLLSFIIFTLSSAAQNYAYNFQLFFLLGITLTINSYHKRRVDRVERKDFAAQKIQEATNLFEANYQKTEKLNTALRERLSRYSSLREIGESFSAKLMLEEILDLAVEIAFDVIPNADSAFLFTVDKPKHKLVFTTCKMASKFPKLKAKNGDIFDHWVMKERQPINVFNVAKDFRFDYKPIVSDRPFQSLISVPLISQSRIIGILRVNSAKENAFTDDELRLLDFISDLVSSAINNAKFYKKTEELSITDSLTDFYNFRYMKQRLEDEVKRSELTGSDLSIIMIDIDHFKDYNDRYGHSAGDKVLVEISNIIKKNQKKGAITARYGGEEFVVILPKADKDFAKVVAETIRKEVEQKTFLLRRKETSVSISAGVVSYTKGLGDMNELLKRADFCLYKAKKEGRNRICVG